MQNFVAKVRKQNQSDVITIPRNIANVEGIEDGEYWEFQAVRKVRSGIHAYLAPNLLYCII